jgi:glutathione S-transferase
MSNRFTLHGHFLSGPTYKVGLMLSLCAQPYSFKLLNMREGEHKQPEYLAKNRYGQAPCLQDGDQYFSQSASILQYLADTLGKLGGKTPEDRAHIREWMFWDFDRLAPGVYRSRGIALGIRKAEPAVAEAYKKEGAAGLGVLNDWLGKQEWLVGRSPTIADVDVYGVVHFAGEAGFDLSETPQVAAWAKRLEALPGFAARETVLPKESRP